MTLCATESQRENGSDEKGTVNAQKIDAMASVPVIPDVRKNIYPETAFNPYSHNVVRGAYSVQFRIPKIIQEQHSYQEFFAIQVHDENKRIYVDKIDFVPNKKQGYTQVTAIIKVIDNQFLWSALIWGLLGISGVVASTFFVDRIDRLVESSNQFFQESTKDIIILLSAVAGIAVGWKVFF